MPFLLIILYCFKISSKAARGKNQIKIQFNGFFSGFSVDFIWFSVDFHSILFDFLKKSNLSFDFLFEKKNQMKIHFEIWFLFDFHLIFIWFSFDFHLILFDFIWFYLILFDFIWFYWIFSGFSVDFSVDFCGKSILKIKWMDFLLQP